MNFPVQPPISTPAANESSQISQLNYLSPGILLFFAISICDLAGIFRNFESHKAFLVFSFINALNGSITVGESKLSDNNSNTSI